MISIMSCVYVRLFCCKIKLFLGVKASLDLTYAHMSVNNFDSSQEVHVKSDQLLKVMPAYDLL